MCISGAEISHCAVESVSCLQDFYPFAYLIQDAFVPNEYNLDTWEKSWSLLPVFFYDSYACDNYEPYSESYDELGIGIRNHLTSVIRIALHNIRYEFHKP